MAKKKMRREESDYISHVCALGCIHCGHPAEPHHPRGITTVGMGQKASNWLVIPLCRDHHNEIHQRMAVGSESEHDLLAKTVKAVVESIIDGNW